MKRLVIDVKIALEAVPFVNDNDYLFCEFPVAGGRIKKYMKYVLNDAVTIYVFQNKQYGMVQDDWIREIVDTLKTEDEVSWNPEETVFILHDKDFADPNTSDGYRHEFIRSKKKGPNKPIRTQYGILYNFMHIGTDAFFNEIKIKEDIPFIERLNNINNLLLGWELNK